jgi:hypothetical protein
LLVITAVFIHCCRCNRLEGAALFNKDIIAPWFLGKRFVLVYKASHHGFTEQDFANACHNQGPTLCIIQDSFFGYTFGGYNPDSWKPNTCTTNKDAFLFTLYNPDSSNTGTKYLLNSGKQSASQSKGCLMEFGDKDIIVQSDKLITIQFPRSFIDTNGRGANVFGTGGNAADIEVFLVK